MIHSKLTDLLSKPSAVFSLLFTPFYILRFFWHVLLTRSGRFLRYYPGHFASHIPSGAQIRRDRERIFRRDLEVIPGIDLRSEDQLNLLGEFAAFYRDYPFPQNESPDFRYYYNNSFYRLYDGFILYAMLRYFQPRRLIEIGSGFSSALVLDVNERFCDGRMELTFIEPYPARLNELVRDPDKSNCRIINSRIQDIGPEVFQELQSGDILFVDTSHVLRLDSDLSKIFNELIPAVPAGAIIHLHDIFWPFEYPSDVILTGRLWNECYIVRAFLQFNTDFEILFFNDYIAWKHPGLLAESLPKCLESHGASLWLRRKA